MAKIDITYHSLLERILTYGTERTDPNRKGVTRINIPSATIKHNLLEDGFPAITTKKLFYRGVAGELLWLLSGDTNIKYLVDNNINIWNKDAYNFYKKTLNTNVFNTARFIEVIKNNDRAKLNHYNTGYSLGSLGAIYGKQWRDFNGFDQIQNLIDTLRANPLGNQHIVTAWNPSELHKMALPPCHWSFEILVEELDKFDRLKIYNKKQGFSRVLGNYVYPENYIQKHDYDIPEPIDFILNDEDLAIMDNYHIPKYKFTLKWHQRSVDTFLGLPFNIASYATLAIIIGKLTNMIPAAIEGDLSNVHIYKNHLKQATTQLNNDPNKFKECELSDFGGFKLNMYGNFNNWLNSMKIDDFKLIGYESYKPIKAKMLAYNK